VFLFNNETKIHNNLQLIICNLKSTDMYFCKNKDIQITMGEISCKYTFRISN